MQNIKVSWKNCIVNTIKCRQTHDILCLSLLHTCINKYPMCVLHYMKSHRTKLGNWRITFFISFSVYQQYGRIIWLHEPSSRRLLTGLEDYDFEWTFNLMSTQVWLMPGPNSEVVQILHQNLLRPIY